MILEPIPGASFKERSGGGGAQVDSTIYLNTNLTATKTIYMYRHILHCRCTNTLGYPCFFFTIRFVSCSVTWSCRSTMMGLCWGRCAAGWSMRGAVLVWLYCLDSSKATCWWCWEKSRWWKVSSWTRELSSTGLSRLPHWCLSGGLQQNTQKGIVATDESIYNTYKQTPYENVWLRQEGVLLCFWISSLRACIHCYL